MKKTLTHRDSRIDLLRFVGISLLILAHVNPPKIIFELRSFDVVLVVFLSGVSYSYSSDKPYMEYIKGRIKRLIIPVELYLIAYFAFFNILSYLRIANITFSMRDYILSFTLISGVGLVWIYRVYILMALEAPLLRKWARYFRNKKVFLVLVAPVALLYELFAAYVSQKSGPFWLIIENFVLYAIGYGIIYAIGILINRVDKKTVWIISGISAVSFACIGLIYNFPSINNFKYPPRLYYITYGLSITTLLWALIGRIHALQIIGETKFVKWFSKNSMLIYLWHSIPLRFLEYGIVDIGEDSFIIRYIFIFVFSLILTIGHVYFRSYLLRIIKTSKKETA